MDGFLGDALFQLFVLEVSFSTQSAIIVHLRYYGGADGRSVKFWRGQKKKGAGRINFNLGSRGYLDLSH